MNANITSFPSEKALSQWSKKAGLKFASSHGFNQAGADDFVAAMRKTGCVVVICDKFYAGGESAYVAFNK